MIDRFSAVNYHETPLLLQKCKSWKVENLQNCKVIVISYGWLIINWIQKEGVWQNNSAIKWAGEPAAEAREEEEGKRLVMGNVRISVKVGFDITDSCQVPEGS